MVVLGGGAVSYERGTPVEGTKRVDSTTAPLKAVSEQDLKYICRG